MKELDPDEQLFVMFSATRAQIKNAIATQNIESITIESDLDTIEDTFRLVKLFSDIKVDDDDILLARVQDSWEEDEEC